MVELKTENSTVSAKKFSSHLSAYLNQIHNKDQGFYTAPRDSETVKEINEFASKIKGKYNHIVILGIGGSALGPICLKQSLTHSFTERVCDCVRAREVNDFPKIPHSIPELFIIDNIDPILIKELEDVIKLEKTLFIVITKSGTTVETMSQYYYFRDKIDEAKLNARDHFVFITSHSKGKLREIATEEKITTFDIPEKIGGRFSVLTPVGLLPAKLIGIKIEEILEGANEMCDKFLSEDESRNIPFQLASIQYALEREGKNIHVLMPYAQKLSGFADWYKQLLAESIGKKIDNTKKIVHTGITPANALGATDQHSQLQLYNEGPNDKLIMFIEVENMGPEIPIPPIEAANLTFNKLIQIEKESTENSLTKNNRPNLTIKIDSVNERALGELFILFEGATAFLGEFYNINAFDQPGVELSKQLTKEKIHGNSQT